MTYKNGKTYLSKKHTTIRKNIKEKNVEGLLWIILSECFEDLDSNVTPRYGKTMLTFVIQQLAVIENKKIYRGVKSSEVNGTSVRSEDIIAKWIAGADDEEEEPSTPEE